MKILQNPLVVGGILVAAAAAVVWNLKPPTRHAYAARPAAAAVVASKASPVPTATAAASRTVSPVSPVSGVTVAGSQGAGGPAAAIETAYAVRRLDQWIHSPPRDPFRMELPPPRRDGTNDPAASDLLALQAVWRQTGGEVVVINDRVMSEGDRILDYRLVQIEPDRVWVEGKRGREEVPFKVVGASTPAAAR